MKINNLLCPKNKKLRAIRKTYPSKPKALYPNHIWGTDMTKILIGNVGWLYLHIVLDWYSKKIIGWSTAPTSKTRDWLDALDMAVNAQFERGIREYKTPSLVSDNGCQPTSKTFGNHCKFLNIKQIFTSYSNPKGNAETERVMRTIKEELVYISEYDTMNDFTKAFGIWVKRYNCEFPHSALKYKTPYQVEREFVNNNTPLNST